MPSLEKYSPKVWEKVPCPFCGSTDYSMYERFGSELQFTYVLCRNCSLVYHSPRPKYDQDFIDSAYASYYQFSETMKLDQNAEVLHSSVNMFRDEVENLLKYDNKRTNVLDIGSAMGTFLFAAKPFYKKAIGLDVSAQMAAYVEKNVGVTVYLEQFNEFSYDEPFSLIHMSHVIEHIPNPVEWLHKAASMLEEDGVLVINVPNKFSLGFRLQHFYYKLGLKKQFSSTWTDPTRVPDHLYEPNVKSMLMLLKANHFDVLDYFTYSRKDPVSKRSILSRLSNRFLHLGSNLSFIVRPQKSGPVK
jgi:2-polyprenyl-3-methyl-5-hydroxy-6-metoxy-1,4-benzoquinol methylase